MSTRGTAASLPEVTISEARGVRYLHLGTPWIQGAMRIDDPLDIELDYVQRMMAWMLFRDEEDVTRGHAVQLGLGAAAITRFCVRRLKMRTTAVELLKGTTVANAQAVFFNPGGPEVSAVKVKADVIALARSVAKHI